MAHRGGFALFLATTSIFAQSAPHSVPPSPDRAITFLSPTPVLGLPVDGSHQQGLCSSDALSYFDPLANATGNSRVLDLYSVATSGEVRHLSRSAPVEFTNAFNRDFFPADAALVTLIEAQIRDTSESDERPRETQYFLYVSGHYGDGNDLLPLDLHFKPLKIAQFGSGEFLVLGWEDANQLEQLAILKADGSLRRFIDLDERSISSRARVTESAGATQASLAGAAFVPYGNSVLLTFPGTARPISVYNASGHDYPISLAYPPGYELHDVLNSGYGSTLVARVQEIPNSQTGKTNDAGPPRQRMFEFRLPSGERVREFTFDKVPVSAITCASNHRLAAIFEQPVGTPGDPTNSTQPTQLVVGTILQ